MKVKLNKNSSLDRWYSLEYDAYLLLGVSKTILGTLNEDHPQYKILLNRIEGLQEHYRNRNAFPRVKCKPYSAQERAERDKKVY